MPNRPSATSTILCQGCRVARKEAGKAYCRRFNFLPPFLPPEFVIMRHVLRCVAFVIFCAVTTAVLNAAEASLAPTAEQLEFFEAKIRPVLVKHCYECHSTKLAAPRGGLRLDDREAVLKGGDSGPIIVAGDLKKSPLLEALKYESLEMPPKGKLPAVVIADFEQWVKMGAPDPRVAASTTKTFGPQPATLKQPPSAHWSFQKLTNPPPPNVKNAQWPQSDIDRFVLAKLEAAGLQPVAAADRRTLIRRASFDLIGLPPEPEQVAAFLNDLASDSDAFAKVVDELLRSPHYGERWGRYWLDIARYGEDQAHTFKARNYPQGYLYRDWVVKAFNDDLPYDQFLIEQIAGDLVTHDRPVHERIPALGLFALGPVYYQDNGEKDKALADEWDDRVDTLIRGTQALTISCARCHDHKFDPLTMADYYGLLGIFASTQYQERPAVPQEVVLAKQQAEAALKEQQLEVDRFLATQARNVREKLIPEIPQYVGGAWRVMNSLKKKANEKKVVTDVAKLLKLNEDLLRRWVAYLEEKPDSGTVKAERPYLDGWRELKKQQDANVDLSDDKAALAAVTAIGETLRQQAELAAATSASPTAGPSEAKEVTLSSELFSDKGLLAIPATDVGRYLTGEPATQLASLNKTRDERKQATDTIKILMAHAVADGQGADMPVYLAGDPRKKGPLAPRSFPAILRNGDSTPFQSTGSGRLELARAIASPDNPLTARVFVNRIWAGHFGAGLVRTPSNFGTLGERPTHPELLDWLAARFIESNWSMKSLHREIMLSATYRLSSSPSATSNPQATDADNHLLWRMNRRRLEVEPWRDSLLAVVGNLDRTLGGPSSNLSNGNNQRRTLYGFVSRHQLDDLLRLFDFPDPNITAGQRTVTTVPLQQLFVLNSEFMVAQSRAFAARLNREASTDDLRVHRAYALLFNRSPSPNELQLGLDFLATTKSESAKLAILEQYALALLGSNEFAFVD